MENKLVYIFESVIDEGNDLTNVTVDSDYIEQYVNGYNESLPKNLNEDSREKISVESRELEVISFYVNKFLESKNTLDSSSFYFHNFIKPLENYEETYKEIFDIKSNIKRKVELYYYDRGDSRFVGFANPEDLEGDDLAKELKYDDSSIDPKIIAIIIDQINKT